jgi:probable DNA-invertase (site-specific recombinase)
MLRVALYARVSTREQDTDNQMFRLKEFAQRRGLEVYDTYMDVCSGAKAHRPDLDRMMKDAKMHCFDKIVAIKLDRMMRSVSNLLTVCDQLKSYNVDLEFVDQQIDTSTPAGKMFFTMLSAFAEFERELISERTKDGLDRARREGKKIGHPKTTLSKDQIERIKKILEEDPQISLRKLSAMMRGISRNTLRRELSDLGLWRGQERGSSEVYK